MFGYCVWYLISKIHNYNYIIKDYNQKLNLKIHPAHITRNYNLSKLECVDEIVKTNYKDYYKFKPIDVVYQESKNNFHALQLDLQTNINTKYHISLSYRTDRPYTDAEIKLVNEYDFKDIEKTDYILSVFDCDSTDSDKWVNES